MGAHRCDASVQLICSLTACLLAVEQLALLMSSVALYLLSSMEDLQLGAAEWEGSSLCLDCLFLFLLQVLPCLLSLTFERAFSWGYSFV